MITANLSVLRETDGTLHFPTASMLPVDLTCEPSGLHNVPAILSTVLVKLVEGNLVEQARWSVGAVVATKIKDYCSGDFTYVEESINDVTGLQNPCCYNSVSAPVEPPAPVYVCPTDVVITTPSTGQIHIGFTAAASKAYNIFVYSDAQGTTPSGGAGAVSNGNNAPAAMQYDFFKSAGTYFIEVREQGSTTPCTITQVVLAPAIVYVCPTLSFTNSSDSVLVAWTGDIHAEKYRLQVFSDAGGATQVGANHDFNVSAVGTVQNFSYSVTGFTPLTQYWYRLSPIVGSSVVRSCGLQTSTTGTALSTLRWAFLSSEPTDMTAVNYNLSMAYDPADNTVSFDVPGEGAVWVAVKIPIAEPDYTVWFNTGLNHGTIPDSSFESIVTVSGFKYLKSRVSLSFDASHQLTLTR